VHKRLLTILVVVCLVAWALPGIASAHVLKVDGNIGAVLHINPDDNPTTGDDTDYTMSFDDASGKFNLSNCDCTVAFIADGKTVGTRQLAVSGKTVSENHYTFTRPAVYTFRFTGKPKTPGAFQSFSLDYLVRVSGGQAAIQPMPPALWIGMGMMVGLVLLAAFAMDYDSNERGKRGSYEETSNR